MKYFVLLLTLVGTASCAHKVDVRVPNIINAGRYSYIKGDDGRVYILTTNSKDFDEALKKLRPGPSSVNKFDLWIVTPLLSGKKPPR